MTRPPSMMRKPVAWRRRLHTFAVTTVGRRGTALLFLAFVDFVYAFSLASPPKVARSNPAFLYVASVAPLWLWSVLWGAVGLVCLWNAFQIKDRVGFAAAMGIKVLWASVFIGAQVAGVERAYATAVVWLGFAGWIAVISTWPEPPTELDHGGPGHG